MTEQTQLPSLAERGLARLRKLADGNGLDPSDVTAFDTQEKTIVLKGKLEVSPFCETQSISYPGGVRGKDTRMANSPQTLQAFVDKHRKEFLGNPEWIVEAAAELKAHETQGWGLQSAKVTLPKKSATYATSRVCSGCQGQKFITCAQCLGKGTIPCTQCAPQYQGQYHGREPCYYCFGSGVDPAQREQPCHICSGTRYAPCRVCQMRGYQQCPACSGRRGATCEACQGSGAVTQEIQVTCGAQTHFTLLTQDLPSGVRRGLDRIGIPNLGKGHADITAVEAPLEENEQGVQEAKIPVLLYSVNLPYAEMKIDFGGKKALVSVVGKRCALSGVPNFLDVSLKPWRDRLRLAASGKAPLEEALEARAIKEILSLTAAGKGFEKEVRRLYPFGFSTEVIETILRDMRLALKQATLKTRTVMAVLCFALCSAFFLMFFMTGLEAQLTNEQSAVVALGLDLTALAGALAASWFVLNFSTRFALQYRFPQMPHALQQTIGKTGTAMLAGIALAFVFSLLLAPVKPLWLAQLLQ